MSVPRLILVHGIIAVLIAGHSYDLARQTDHWPFSSYGMFSRVGPTEHLSLYRLFGVTAAGEKFLLIDREFLEPFDRSRLESATSRLYEHHEPERLQAALRDCRDRYESHRVAGRHDGPSISDVRLYRLYWRLDPAAGNADQPDGRLLMSGTD